MYPVPQNWLCSPVPLIFGRLLPCSPEKYALVPLFPKTPWSASLIVYNPGNAFSEARLATLVRWANWWKDGFIFSFNVEWIGLLNGTSTVASVQHTTCDYSPSIISEVLTRWKLFIPYIMTDNNNYFTTYCPCHIFRSMFYLYHHRSRYETPQYKPAPIAQLVECPLRGTGGPGFDPGPRHTKVVKNGASCSSLGTQTYGVALGLVDPVSR